MGLVRVSARDARLLLLSDCVHNVGPEFSPPFAKLVGVCSAIIVVATAFPAPEHREEVITAFEAAIEKVHAEEDGCELYALHEGPDGRLVMIEKYTSDEAVTAHRAGSGLAGLRESLNGKLSAPMDVQVLTPRNEFEYYWGELLLNWREIADSRIGKVRASIERLFNSAEPGEGRYEHTQHNDDLMTLAGNYLKYAGVAVRS